MRILFLAHRLPYPPNKGDKIRSFRELEMLARRHEVDLFCFYDQPEDSQYFPEVRQYCRDLYTERISGLHSRTQAALACSSGRPFTTAFYHSRKMAQRIRKAISERKYDLIFVFSSSMAPYVEDASEPRVLDMVDVDSDKWKQYAEYTPPPKSWLWAAEGRRLAKYEARWVRGFSMTLLSTCAEAELLKRNVPSERIEVLENYMDLSYFDPNTITVPSEIAARQPYIIFTGSMDYFPNVDAVRFFYREVFTFVKAALPGARFVIAGRNPTRSVLELASDPAVSVTGSVPDIRPYLRGAAVSVCPLRIARGVQTKILEAMAMDVPVAISSQAAKAIPERLLLETCVEDDPQRLAAHLIRKLRQDLPSTKSEPRRILREYYSALCWQDKLESLLQQVLRSRNESEQKTADFACELPGSAQQIHDGDWKTVAPRKRPEQLRSL
jgi:polysaccharide biosynthesis protein PslH